MSHSVSKISEKGAISVVIPTFNAPELCAATVRSLSAGGPTMEIVVVDDGSTQDNRRMLDSALKALGAEWLANSCPSIRYLWQKNYGAYNARLDGVTNARGEYVKFLDHDDRLVSGVLARELALAKETCADVVMTDWHQGIRIDQETEARLTQHHRAPEYDDPLTDFLELGGVYTGAALYRRTLFKNLEPITTWKPRLKDDWAIFGQICLHHPGKRFVTLHEASYVWFHHRDQQTATARRDENIAEIYQFLAWLDDELERRGGFTERRRCAMARYYLKNAILLCEQDQKAWRRVAGRIRALCQDTNMTVGNRLSQWSIGLFGIESGICNYVRVKQLLGWV